MYTFRYAISCCVDFTLFGVATVFLILASQNLQSLLGQVPSASHFCRILARSSILKTQFVVFTHSKNVLSYEQTERQRQRQIGSIVLVTLPMMLGKWRGVDFGASWGASHTSQWRSAAAARSVHTLKLYRESAKSFHR